MNVFKHIHKLKTLPAFQLIGIAAFYFVASNCSNDFESPETPSGSTINEIVLANDDLDILFAALTQTGLAATLDNTNSGQFTIFAPVDAAFLTYLQGVYSDPSLTEESAIAKLQSLTNTSIPLNIATLVSRLNYHIISSEIKANQIVGAQTFTTINNARLSLSVVGSDVLINTNTGSTGGEVTTTDLDASNGVLHAIDKVLSVPSTSTTILTPLGMTISYSTSPPNVTGGAKSGADANGNDVDVFAYAVRKSEMTTVLIPNKTPLPDFTIFAPTDNSFLIFYNVATEAEAISLIDNMNKSEVADLVKYHILSGRYLSTDLYSGRVMNTIYTTKSFTIAISADPTPVVSLVDNNISTDPSVTVFNNVNYNGVFHTINAVLQAF